MTQSQRSRGLNDAVVLKSALDFAGPWLVIATLPIVAVWIGVFSDPRNLSGAPFFTFGTLSAAVVWGVRPWLPWKMFLYRLQHGPPPPPWDDSPIQEATAEFFASRDCKVRQSVYIGLGAAWPWVLYPVTRLLGVQPLRPNWTAPIPFWAMFFLGVLEGVRGRATALRVLARRFERNWTSVQERATEIRNSID